MRALLIVLIVFLSLNALLNLISAIYSLITDDSDGFWGAPSFLASVALIIALAQELTEL